MTLYIAAIGITFVLFIIFILQMVVDYDNESDLDDEF